MNELLLYTTEDGQSRIQLRADSDTVWLSQVEMAELFNATKQNISLHLRNIFADGELDSQATVKESLTVQTEGQREVRRTVTLYNLDAIMAVGYRVRSPRGVQFRRWATTVLNEYLRKGFVMDDERLKNPDGRPDYFDEMLERIRDIRASVHFFKMLFLCFAAFSTGCGSNSSEAPLTMPFEAVACPAISTHTAIQGGSFKLINDPHEFVELYLATDLNSQDEAPLIDFETRSAIAIHLGEKTTGGHQVQVTSVEDHGSKIIVRYEAVSPSVGCGVDTGITYPYCFVSISKTTKPIEYVATNVRKCDA